MEHDIDVLRDIIEEFLNETGSWSAFENFLEQRGEKPSDWGFEDE